MASVAAKEVAQEVLETVGKGRRPNITKIAIKKGYTPKSAAAGTAQKSKTYKATIAPLVQRLEEERDAIVLALKKQRKNAKYRDLIDGLDKITKNLQLLTGGATANIAVGVRRMNDQDLEALVDAKNE